jgi:iron complex outermembrane recepter protein
VKEQSAVKRQMIWIFGVGLLVVQPAKAEVQNLQDFKRPALTVEDWMAQQQPISVTDVQIRETELGLEILLETANQEPLQGRLSTAGNVSTIVIPNAQLQRPFSRLKPLNGVDSIEVSAIDATSIQIRIVGDAIAQIQQSQSGLKLSLETAEPEEEVTVTAQKRPERAQDVPISITTLPRQTLEDAQINSLESVARNTPNFLILPTSSGTFTSYSLRGLGNNNPVNRDSVGFFIDDVPYDFGAFLDFDLADLERVEVLRGSQSTLYGRNTQSGVVNIITRPPSNRPEVRTSASYGNYNSTNVQLSLSDAILPDQLSFRLAGNYKRRDGFFDNTFLNETVGDRASGTLRGQLLWTPSKDWNISFVGSYFGTNGDGDVYAPLTQKPFTTENDHVGFNTLDSNAQALRIAYTQPGFQLTSITTRQSSTQASSADADFSSDDLFRVVSNTDIRIFSQELRVQSPSNTDRFRWLFGGYYESRQFNDFGGLQISDAGAAIFGLPTAGRDFDRAEIYQTTYALFGQVDYKPIDPLTLTVGLRYDASNGRLNRQPEFITSTGETIPGAAFRDVETSDRVFIPRFALQYQFSPNLTAYGSVTRGYKPSGLNYRTDSLTDLIFDQETSWNYEIGLKSSWLNDRLGLNLSGFIHKIDRYQVSVFDNNLLNNQIVNADVDITGLELELRATPVKGLDFTAGLGLTNAQFKDFINPSTGESLNGNKLPYVPSLTYNLAAQYRSENGVFGRVELLGVGTYFFDEANDLKQSPFALVNARLGYEGKNYGIYLFANNLFDKAYLTNVISFGQASGVYGDRRTYGIRANITF